METLEGYMHVLSHTHMSNHMPMHGHVCGFAVGIQVGGFVAARSGCGYESARSAEALRHYLD